MRRCASQCLGVVLAACFLGMCFSSGASAQVAITLGVQETYDDNIFLENDRRRPAPFVLNGALDEDISDGQLSILRTEQNDGRPNDDFITNVFLAIASDIPQLDKYGSTALEAKVGVLTFARAENQDRLTLDGLFRFDVTENIIPRPYYFSFFTSLSSQSNESTVAEGTATRASQSMDIGASTGIRGVKLSPRTEFALGYSGNYHIFIGELLFDAPEINRFEEQGSDYHTHLAITSLDYSLSEAWTVGLTAQGGVQLFTNVETSEQINGRPAEAEDLDRTNAEVRAISRFQASEKLSFAASAGVAYSRYHESRDPFELIVVGEDGESNAVLFDPNEDETSFVFNLDSSYVYMPGSLVSVGAMQNFSTNLNGERLTNRAVFASVAQAIGDRFRLSGNTAFFQFSSDDDLSSSVDRFEAGTSLTYSLTQFSSLTIGYNFIDQSSDDSLLDERLRFRSADYEVNRAFIALNVGLVGLPL